MKKDKPEEALEDKDEDIKELQLKKKKQEITMPKKGKYRMRAHINPLNEINYPVPFAPSHVDWSIHYPLFFGGTNEQNLLMYDNSNFG